MCKNEAPSYRGAPELKPWQVPPEDPARGQQHQKGDREEAAGACWLYGSATWAIGFSWALYLKQEPEHGWLSEIQKEAE